MIWLGITLMGVWSISTAWISQIKIRGFRIDLGAIETVLSGHPQVDEAVAIVIADEPGDARLTAYIVAKDGQVPDVLTLREYLRTKLPDYMVPQHLVALEAFPLTPWQN